MKKFFPISLFVACLFVATALLSSCEFDASEEPDHPYYASYAMSADYTEYNGPDQLLLDFQNWVKENQVYYDKQITYSTGGASEYAETDAEAIKRFNENFVPKVKAYFEELKSKLANGIYGNVKVDGKFYVYLARFQGEGSGTLKSESIFLVYP